MARSETGAARPHVVAAVDEHHSHDCGRTQSSRRTLSPLAPHGGKAGKSEKQEGRQDEKTAIGGASDAPQGRQMRQPNTLQAPLHAPGKRWVPCCIGVAERERVTKGDLVVERQWRKQGEPRHAEEHETETPE